MFTPFLSKDELSSLVRDTSFTCLVGSHNYNLNDNSSDKDYKVFVNPRFDDFYFKHQLSIATRNDNGNDYEYKDVRSLYELLSKGNPAYIEMLFSVEVNSIDTLYTRLRGARDEIIHLHLDGLLNATVGHITQKINNMSKPTEKTQAAFDKCGYNPKQLMHAIRLQKLLNDYYMDDFGDYRQSLRNWDDKSREFLLDIKHGNVNLKHASPHIESVKSFINDIDSFRTAWNNKANIKFKELRDQYIVTNEEMFTYDSLLHTIIYSHIHEQWSK